MDLNFNRMRDRQQVDFYNFVLREASGKGVEVYVGCDSQNYPDSTVYVSTILFRYPNNGAKVIYRKERLPKIIDMWSRLWAELERSIEMAQFLRETCGIRITQIDLDYNSNPSFASNKLCSAAMGYIESLGFSAKTKPNLLMATWAANVLCH